MFIKRSLLYSVKWFHHETGEHIMNEDLRLSGKAIVIDDEPFIAEMLQMILEDYGLDVDSETSPLKALEKIKKTNYDYIFTDFMMDELRGDQFLVKARNQDFKGSKYVVVTGGIRADNQAEIEQSLTEMTDAIIYKPLAPEDLYTCITKIEARHECA
jgi:CheY-like chemotaxis protein